MMQKLKSDALWCKSAKNLAICFIYEASINLWCDLMTLFKTDELFAALLVTTSVTCREETCWTSWGTWMLCAIAGYRKAPFLQQPKVQPSSAVEY